MTAAFEPPLKESHDCAESDSESASTALSQSASSIGDISTALQKVNEHDSPRELSQHPSGSQRHKGTKVATKPVKSKPTLTQPTVLYETPAKPPVPGGGVEWNTLPSQRQAPYVPGASPSAPSSFMQGEVSSFTPKLHGVSKAQQPQAIPNPTPSFVSNDGESQELADTLSMDSAGPPFFGEPCPSLPLLRQTTPAAKSSTTSVAPVRKGNPQLAKPVKRNSICSRPISVRSVLTDGVTGSCDLGARTDSEALASCLPSDLLTSPLLPTVAASPPLASSPTKPAAGEQVSGTWGQGELPSTPAAFAPPPKQSPKGILQPIGLVDNLPAVTPKADGPASQAPVLARSGGPASGDSPSCWSFRQKLAQHERKAAAGTVGIAGGDLHQRPGVLAVFACDSA